MQKLLKIKFGRILLIIITALCIHYYALSNHAQAQLERDTVGRAVDQRNTQAQEANSAIYSCIQRTLEVKDLDTSLSALGVEMQDKSWMFAEVNGKKYKIALEPAQ